MGYFLGFSSEGLAGAHFMGSTPEVGSIWNTSQRSWLVFHVTGGPRP